MRFTDTQDEMALRHRIRTFLESHLDEDVRNVAGWGWLADELLPDTPALAAWRRTLAESGWLALSWPVEYGGAGLSISGQWIYYQESARYGAPLFTDTALTLVGPTIIKHGSKEQRDRLLPEILYRGAVWCDGLSEPDAGSDLASLSTSAVRHGDSYIVNGRKVWTSGAPRSNYVGLLARSNPEAQRHRGISFFAVKLDSEGISVRPLENMAGEPSFAEIVFEDVVVPAQNLIGGENEGWRIIVDQLGMERALIWLVPEYGQIVECLSTYARDLKRDRARSIRQALAARAIEVEVTKCLIGASLTSSDTESQALYSSAIKILCSELEQRIAETGLCLTSFSGAIGAPDNDERWSIVRRKLARMYLYSQGATVGGGTSEILKNIIATRSLGLPRA